MLNTTSCTEILQSDQFHDMNFFYPWSQDNSKAARGYLLVTNIQRATACFKLFLSFLPHDYSEPER